MLKSNKHIMFCFTDNFNPWKRRFGGPHGMSNFGSMSHQFSGQGMTGKRNITFDLFQDKRSRKVNFNVVVEP